MTDTLLAHSSRRARPALARFIAAAALCTLALSIAQPVRAAWPHDPATGLLIAPESSGAPIAVPDGAGGTVVVYKIAAPQGEVALNARHIAADGTIDGPYFVASMNVPGVFLNPVAASDGAGGVFVAWQKHEYSDPWGDEVYAQHMLASGDLQGPGTGYKVCSSVAGQQSVPVITTDGNGGAWIAWGDSRTNNVFDNDVYLQHVGSLGSLAFPTGKAICTDASHQRYISLAPDGFSGVLIAWDDRRNFNRDIYAQRVSIAGSSLWLADGVQVSTKGDEETRPTIVGDGAGGAIVSWIDEFGSSANVVARSITAAGVPRAPSTGVPLSTLTCYGQTPTVLVPDGSGGAFASFEMYFGSGVSLNMQHFTANNSVAWGPFGVSVAAVATPQYGAQMVADGTGGVITTWLDNRSGSMHLYAQRFNDAGQPRWATNGVAVCTAGPGSQNLPQLVADGAGNAVAVWEDTRSNQLHVYGQRIDALGQLGDARPRITLIRDHAQDQGGVVDLSWSASDIDANPSPGVTEYRLWRSAPTNAAAAQALARERGVTSDPEEAVVTGQLFVPSHASATDYAWEYMVTVPATQAASYTRMVATTTDSFPTSNRRTAFMVQARKPSAPTPAFWFSPADSGYSVDNLPPSTPSPFVGAYAVGSTHLSWPPNAEPDIASYRLYRGNSLGFVPGPANLVISKSDTGYVDVTGTAWYYKLIAVDVHGNLSQSAAVVPPGVLAVEEPSAPAFALSAPQPNPARAVATLRWVQPSAGHARLALFDLAGREVRCVVNGVNTAGPHECAFDLRDNARAALAPGVYLVRLDAVGLSLVSRMVVVR